MKAALSALFLGILYPIGQVHAYDVFTVSRQTWYGYPDNCLNGYYDGCGTSATAYDCVGRGAKAGGDGSYNNPLTYATKSGGPLHQPCEVTWFPYLEKYLVMADTCTGCSDSQIDIWIGDGNGKQAEVDCENNAPSGDGHKLIRDGSSSHKANTNALWSNGGGCQVQQNTYPNGN